VNSIQSETYRFSPKCDELIRNFTLSFQGRFENITLLNRIEILEMIDEIGSDGMRQMAVAPSSRKLPGGFIYVGHEVVIILISRKESLYHCITI
jgi:hypothetical protein